MDEQTQSRADQALQALLHVDDLRTVEAKGVQALCAGVLALLAIAERLDTLNATLKDISATVAFDATN